MPTLKRLIPVTLLAALTACAVPSPAPGSAGPMSQPESGPALLMREQADPPQPLLEHPGKPPANGYVWIAGRWALLEGRYRWVTERYARLLGRSRDELLKLHLQDVLAERGGEHAAGAGESGGGHGGHGSGGDVNLWGGGGRSHGDQGQDRGGESFFGGSQCAGHHGGNYYRHYSENLNHNPPGTGGNGEWTSHSRGGNGTAGICIVYNYQ